MIYVINRKPELQLAIQEVSSESKTRIRAGASHQNVSIGDKFDCVIDLKEGVILKTIDAKVNSILFKDESVLELPRGRGAEIGLEINEVELEWLKGVLKTRKVQLSNMDNLEHNVYSKNVIELESIQNNIQVQKLLPRLGLDLSSVNLLFIARAMRNDISLYDQFDLIWNMDNAEVREDNPIRLEAIFSRYLQPEKILYRGVPTLVLLSKSNDDIKVEENLSLLHNSSNHLMIGKRVVLLDFIEEDEDLHS